MKPTKDVLLSGKHPVCPHAHRQPVQPPRSRSRACSQRAPGTRSRGHTAEPTVTSGSGPRRSGCAPCPPANRHRGWRRVVRPPAAAPTQGDAVPARPAPPGERARGAGHPAFAGATPHLPSGRYDPASATVTAGVSHLSWFWPAFLDLGARGTSTHGTRHADDARLQSAASIRRSRPLPQSVAWGLAMHLLFKQRGIGWQSRGDSQRTGLLVERT